MDFNSNLILKKSRNKEVYWQKNRPIESSKRNFGETESGNHIYKGESKLKVIMPMGL